MIGNTNQQRHGGKYTNKHNGKHARKTQLWDQFKKIKKNALKSSNYIAKKILHWSKTLFFFSPIEEMQFVLSFECWAIAKFRCNDDGVEVTRCLLV